MLVADGGGGGTDWAGMSIEMMRALVQNPNVEAHHRLLTGWQRSYELVSDHMTQMINYQENLAAVWPPEKSAASAAYLAQLDHLIADLNATYEASVANHDAFASATLSISLAQHNFEEIWQEHEANRAKLAEYQNDLAMSSAATFDTTPPVTSLQQETVRQKAITLMSSVSSDLAQAQVRIVRPAPYVASTHSEDKTTPFNGSSYSAPLIPPITPTPVGGFSSSGSSARPSSPSHFGPGNSGAGAPISAQPSNGLHRPGLVLVGATSPVASSPANEFPPGSSITAGGSGPESTVNPGPPPGIGPIVPNSDASILPPGRSPIRGLRGKGTARPDAGMQEVIRVMPPGGLIGGNSALGLGPPVSGRSCTRLVNPIGGVIGEGETSGQTSNRGIGQGGPGIVPGGLGAPSTTRGTGRTGRSAALGERISSVGSRETSSENTYGRFDSRRPGHQDKSDTSRWDPDNPWDTAEGVDPVVLPPREQRIDPGSAIGLD